MAAIAGLAMAAAAVLGARAQAPEPWVLFGHDNASSTTVIIDTVTGQATTLGPTGFASSSSGMAASSAPVRGTGGATYPAGAVFGLLRDANFAKDYVTILDGQTGAMAKIVELDLAVGGRGLAFGTGGSSMYAIVPPGELFLVDPTTGARSLVGEVRDAAGTQWSAVSLEYDADTESFLSFAGPTNDTLVRMDSYTAGATVIGTLADLNACTLCAAPGTVAGPGGITFPAGTLFTVNNLTNVLHAIRVDTPTGAIIENRPIGLLGPAASQVCGMAFGMRAIPTATPSATATPSPRPTATATPPGPNPSCVCRTVTKQVPPVVVADALANPQRFYGWRYPLNAGKPRGPDNPPRECLTLQNVNVPYHPLWNKPIWRVGCP